MEEYPRVVERICRIMGYCTLTGHLGTVDDKTACVDCEDEEETPTTPADYLLCYVGQKNLEVCIQLVWKIYLGYPLRPLGFSRHLGLHGRSRDPSGKEGGTQ